MQEFDDSQAMLAALATDVHEALVDDTRLVAERFFDVHIVGASREEQIADIAELIGYGSNLSEIMQKMALGEIVSDC